MSSCQRQLLQGPHADSGSVTHEQMALKTQTGVLCHMTSCSANLSTALAWLKINTGRVYSILSPAVGPCVWRGAGQGRVGQGMERQGSGRAGNKKHELHYPVCQLQTGTGSPYMSNSRSPCPGGRSHWLTVERFITRCNAVQHCLSVILLLKGANLRR